MITEINALDNHLISYFFRPPYLMTVFSNCIW